MVEGDGQRLLQVLVNLLSNARDASQPGGEIRLETRAVGDLATISVTDSGSGIPSEAIDQVLEPFFTTKAPGEGTGLGLSLVYAIVRDMRGNIAIESPLDPASGRGTRVTVTLPRAATDALPDVLDAAEH
jgi:signal transduction histidine kinase